METRIKIQKNPLGEERFIPQFKYNILPFSRWLNIDSRGWGIRSIGEHGEWVAFVTIEECRKFIDDCIEYDTQKDWEDVEAEIYP